MAVSLTIKGLSLQEIRPGIWRIDPIGKMKAGVHLVGSPEMFEPLREDKSLDQAVRVAALPGVVDPVMVMADVHQGYGFPIGGVAAFDLKQGVVSPGGVGYDINCGVRVLTTGLQRDSLEGERLKKVISDLYDLVPSGVGSKRTDLSLRNSDLNAILSEGLGWAVKRGFADQSERDHIEEGGCLSLADPSKVSARAKARGENQLGTLGSGNHFLEIQCVSEIYEEQIADAFGLFPNQVVVTIHTGSRGLGYQTCSDYLEVSLGAAKKYGLELPDRELAASPITSPEGQDYLAAMSAAANFAFVNRQVISHWVRSVFKRHFGKEDLPLLYDVCHNIAKYEKIPVDGKLKRVCVHRKGATRAYPPGHPELSKSFLETGQPVIVPGDMGRYSYLLAGQKDSLEISWGSACHGAGRALSRSAAKKKAKGRSIEAELEKRGIVVRAAGRSTVVEEMPEAYKDVAQVVQATCAAGIAQPVAKLVPMGVVKG